MKYYVEFDPRGFEFWGGAEERMDSATDEQREEVYNHIEIPGAVLPR